MGIFNDSDASYEVTKQQEVGRGAYRSISTKESFVFGHRDFADVEGKFNSLSFGREPDFSKDYHNTKPHVSCLLSDSPAVLGSSIRRLKRGKHVLRIEGIVSPSDDDGTFDIDSYSSHPNSMTVKTTYKEKVEPHTIIVEVEITILRDNPTDLLPIKITHVINKEVSLFLYGRSGKGHVDPLIIDNIDYGQAIDNLPTHDDVRKQNAMIASTNHLDGMRDSAITSLSGFSSLNFVNDSYDYTRRWHNKNRLIKGVMTGNSAKFRFSLGNDNPPNSYFSIRVDTIFKDETVVVSNLDEDSAIETHHNNLRTTMVVAPISQVSYVRSINIFARVLDDAQTADIDLTINTNKTGGEVSIFIYGIQLGSEHVICPPYICDAPNNKHVPYPTTPYDALNLSYFNRHLNSFAKMLNYEFHDFLKDSGPTTRLDLPQAHGKYVCTVACVVAHQSGVVIDLRVSHHDAYFEVFDIRVKDDLKAVSYLPTQTKTVQFEVTIPTPHGVFLRHKLVSTKPTDVSQVIHGNIMNAVTYFIKV